MQQAPVLKAVNISKSFSGVPVLDKVRLELEKGKVHALMGENGAGKSTFMNILMGMFPPDEGDIFMEGEKVHFSGARDALRHGISMIHQELLVFPELTVAENIFMGREPGSRWGLFNRNALNREAERIMQGLETGFPVTARMKELSTGEMQMVEIAKAVSNNASVLIMDEPTSAISQKEAGVLFRVIGMLKEQGKAIVYISHKMDEIFRLADTVTVLRDGRHIATRACEELRMDDLITLIVGREMGRLYRREPKEAGEVILETREVHSPGVQGVSFQLRRGEVLGVAGLMGSGRTALAHAISGVERISSGELILNGTPVRLRSPREARRLGIGLVTEDRKRMGLVLSSSVKRNITLPSLKKHGRGLLLDRRRENAVTDEQMARFRIRAASRNQAVERLSGGNQQKVVLSGVGLNDPQVIVLDEPTRGVDVGAKQEIYEYIDGLAAAGKAVLLISSELPEILALSDRVLVMREGRIGAALDRREATQELIMQHAMT